MINNTKIIPFKRMCSVEGRGNGLRPATSGEIETNEMFRKLVRRLLQEKYRDNPGACFLAIEAKRRKELSKQQPVNNMQEIDLEKVSIAMITWAEDLLKK